MKKITFALALFLSCGCSFATADTPLHLEENAGTIVVHNRILAKVLGKTISVIDVMKKMDVFLNHYYPEYTDNTLAKYQFYSTQWRETLTQMIDTELMLADADEKEIPVTDGDVRETLQERFGPNIMASMDKLGITYEEARKMIHSELIVQRMTWFKINSKAILKVNSHDVKETYDEYCLKNPPLEEWKYQVLSIRAGDVKAGEAIAQQAFALLSKARLDFPLLAEKLKEQQELTEDVVINVSETHQLKDKELSKAHKDILAGLAKGSYSAPISQVSRVDNSIVYRIFYLMDHTRKEVPPLPKVANKIRDDLIQRAAEKESTIYLGKLRERFGYDQKYWQDLIPADFQPFTLN